MDYYYLFSDKQNGFISTAQIKAARTMILFEEALKSCTSQDQVQYAAFYYMDTVIGSNEINLTDQNVILHCMPVAIMSTSYWTK